MVHQKNGEIPTQIQARVDRVDISKLLPFSYKNRDQLSSADGIYFVGHSPDRIVYVGKTGDSQGFRSRHRKHHRQHTFEEIERTDGPLFIWCWPLPLELKKTRVDSIVNLALAEKAFIDLLRPKINDTPAPYHKPKQVSSTVQAKYRYKGCVYVSLNFLPDYSVDITPGSAPGFHTSFSKLHYVQRAIEEKSYCFMISSLPIDCVSLPTMSAYKRILSPDPYWRRETTLYFLEYMFRAKGYGETPYRSDFDLCIYGDLESSVIRRVYLNELVGFKDFRHSHLTMGMTNCSGHPFTSTLLTLVKG